MADTTAQQAEDLLRSQRDLAGAFGRFTKMMETQLGVKGSSKGRDKSRADEAALGAKRKETGLVKKSTEALGKHLGIFGHFSGHVEDAAEGVRKFAELFGAGALVWGIKTFAMQTVDTYRKVADVGETFGGSVLAMHQAAADAQLPLETFAEQVAKNSNVIATMGYKPYFDLNKQLRQNLQQFGMLGMSISDVNDMMGTYMETNRVFGMLTSKTSNDYVQDMKDLATETSGLATLTGKSRKQILDQTNTALQEATVMAHINSLSGAAAEKYRKSLTEATASLAAQPGAIGENLAKFLTQTVGRGTAIFADFAKTINDAGASPLIDTMDRFGKKVRDGTSTFDDTIEFQSQYAQQIHQMMPMLQMQATAGNEAAKELITMSAGMKDYSKMTHAEIEQARHSYDQQTTLTKLMLNFENIWNRLSGAIRGKFLEAVDKASDALAAWVDSDAFKTLETEMGVLGTNIGKFFSRLMTGDNITKFVEALEWIGGVIYDVGKSTIEGVTSFVDWLNSEDVKGFVRNWVIPTLQLLGDAIAGVAKTIFASIKWIDDFVASVTGSTKLGNFAGGLAAIAVAYEGIKTIGGIISKMFGLSKATFTIDTAEVNIGSTTGGGGGDGIAGDLMGLAAAEYLGITPLAAAFASLLLPVAAAAAALGAMVALAEGVSYLVKLLPHNTHLSGFDQERISKGIGGGIDQVAKERGQSVAEIRAMASPSIPGIQTTTNPSEVGSPSPDNNNTAEEHKSISEQSRDILGRIWEELKKNTRVTAEAAGP